MSERQWDPEGKLWTIPDTAEEVGGRNYFDLWRESPAWIPATIIAGNTAKCRDLRTFCFGKCKFAVMLLRPRHRRLTARQAAQTLISTHLEQEMPEVSRFLGIIIRMCTEAGAQHHVPHPHAYYQDYKATYRIDTGELLAGFLHADNNAWWKRGLNYIRKNC